MFHRNPLPCRCCTVCMSSHQSKRYRQGTLYTLVTLHPAAGVWSYSKPVDEVSALDTQYKCFRLYWAGSWYDTALSCIRSRGVAFEGKCIAVAALQIKLLVLLFACSSPLYTSVGHHQEQYSSCHCWFSLSHCHQTYHELLLLSYPHWHFTVVVVVGYDMEKMKKTKKEGAGGVRVWV